MSLQRRVLPPPRRKQPADASLAIVNIVLLLLFFFLATGSLLNSPSYGVAVSETGELPIEVLPEPVLVVEESGALTLNGEPVADALLGASLEGETVLHVLVSRDAPATDLLDLLERPDLEGIEIQLVTVNIAEGT